ncbi:MAG: PQQ-binding-like beta-propeller repeat protein, partial [Bacteroidales bacterium]|nr:PQQ-binding-like beta-propeller repeat protein [Bacteroidales bacterium]
MVRKNTLHLCPWLFLLLAAAALAAPVTDPQDAAHTGERIYLDNCATCHEAGVPKAPSQGMLQFMAPDAIYHALTEGVMAVQVPHLSDADKQQVAEYLTGHALNAAAEDSFLWCRDDAAAFDPAQPPRVSGWGVSHDNRREFSTELAGIHRGNVSDLKVKWAFGFPGAVRARSHPVLGGGAVHVGSQDGRVYALDRDSGCVRWIFRARAEVRTAIVMSPWDAENPDPQPRLYFGDYLGNVYAIDAR